MPSARPACCWAFCLPDNRIGLPGGEHTLSISEESKSVLTETVRTLFLPYFSFTFKMPMVAVLKSATVFSRQAVSVG